MLEPLCDERGPRAWSVPTAARLRLAREALELSQEEAGESIGCSARSIARWERGAAEPSLRKLVRLADLYGVSIDWLTGRLRTNRPLRAPHGYERANASEPIQGPWR